MSETVVQIEGLSKRYRLGVIGGKRLVDDVSRQWAKFRGKPDPLAKVDLNPRPGTNGKNGISSEEIWALKDVSLDVKQGEVLGIIGKNGAGKSTLLKILSRVTAPTSGEVKVKGRIASLLEVGTGFHPELTGRENVFLNGAILGMTKDEIRKRFDEIVEFSEIGKFIDTPVKRYSSGMYVRLAFAVAADLDPEILIVDEVLAVGDAAFQKKCLGKMENVASLGRTVLFVSHDMNNMTRLCPTGILLEQGKVVCQGAMTDVVTYYFKGDTLESGFAELSNRGDRSGNGDAAWQSIELLKDAERTSTFALGDEFTVRTCITLHKDIPRGQVFVVVTTDAGTPVHGLESANEGVVWTGKAGTYTFDVSIPSIQLYPGGYAIDLWIGDAQSGRVDYLKKAITFNVVQAQSSGLVRPLSRRDGVVFTHSNWSYRRCEPGEVLDGAVNDR